ncbi:hypothetical protein [Methanobrevibacter arboriphilus]|uniref:hypothetical protein n=1 Tax=Methanobrevibacter arboriphilus TaxID=39441 RepID=UPI001C8013A3|nr:hypothetical protein [Methanobrevibacter arboriphilus]
MHTAITTPHITETTQHHRNIRTWCLSVCIQQATTNKKEKKTQKSFKKNSIYKNKKNNQLTTTL